MVHQYDHRDRQSGLSRKYTEQIENEPDVIKKLEIQNEILGHQNKSVNPTVNSLALNPNQKFIEEYEKQAIQKREKQAKALVKESFNEKGEKYALIWNNEEFRKIHDPIGKNLLYNLALKFFNILLLVKTPFLDLIYFNYIFLKVFNYIIFLFYFDHIFFLLTLSV